MNKIIVLAKEKNARLLLTGDTKQHNSVEAGDAFRIIQQRGGLKVAYVNEIQRQKNALEYRKAVKDISNGNIEKGFDRFDKMGSIKEIENKSQRHDAIANDYLTYRKAKKTSIIVAPTHKEGEEVTENIRNKLKANGLLDKTEREYTRNKNLGFTDAQKQDSSNYQEGQSIQFHQNAKGFKAGNKYDISRIENDEVFVKGEAAIEKKISLKDSKRFNVYQKTNIQFAKGDELRITNGGRSMKGKRLNNGNIYTITGFDKEGNIQLSNKSTIDKNFRNFNHGYTTTSHSSQGKTVDNVLIAQSSQSFAASSDKQFYVSVSRGRKNATIYTDDKIELKNKVQKSGDRISASDVVDIRKHQRFVSRSNYQKEQNTPNQFKDHVRYARK